MELPVAREVIVVDDGSTDGTARVLEAFSRRGVKVLRHPERRGKGAAVLTGLEAATGDWLLVQDADLEYDPRDIPALLGPALREGARVVYGSRILRPENPASYRRYYWGGRFLSLWTNLLYGSRLTDEPTGYKLFETGLLRSLGLRARGFEFCPEATAKVLSLGVAIVETPIRYRPRTLEEGKKIRWTDGAVALWTLLRGSRRGGLLLPAAVVLLQLLVSLPRLGLPYVEGRAHWVNDDAYFLQMAMHSNDGSLESPWKLFGLALYRYARCGEVQGLEHYPHHPVLTPALFRPYARLAGHADWVPRSFALLASFASTFLLFLLVREGSGSAGLAGAASLLYALLPLNYMYQDAFKYEGLAAAAALLCLLLLLRAGRDPLSRRLLPASLFLLFHAEWAVYPLGLGVLALLARRAAAAPALRPSAWAALAASAAGVASNLAVLRGLGFDLERMSRQFRHRAGDGMSRLGAWGWARSQLDSFEMNFGLVHLAVLAGLTAWSLSRRRRLEQPLTAYGLLFLATGLLYIATFRNLSYVHHYSQWYLGAALVLLAAGAAASAGPRPTPALRSLGLAGFAVLLGLSAAGARRLEDRVLPEDGFALPEDIAWLKRQTRRLVVSWEGPSGPRDWWRSTSVRLYSDPVYKSAALGRPREELCGGVAFLEQLDRLDPETDLLVSQSHAGARRALREAVEARFRGISLAPDSRSPTFVGFVPSRP